MRFGVRFLLLAFGLMSLALVGAASDATTERSGPVARLELSPATVGQPSQIRWRLADPKTSKPVPARLTLTITHLEEGKQVFVLDSIPTTGNFILQFHFTDGSSYRVASVAQVDDREPIQEERTITATTKEPPQGAILPSLFFFLTVIALGLAAGRISRRKDLLTFTRARTPSHK